MKEIVPHPLCDNKRLSSAGNLNANSMDEGMAEG